MRVRVATAAWMLGAWILAAGAARGQSPTEDADNSDAEAPSSTEAGSVSATPTDAEPVLAPSQANVAAEQAPTLARYLEAMSAARLVAAETGNVERLRRLVRLGEGYYFDGRYDDAALVLYEVVESPRFADFAGVEDFASAEVMIAGALARLGALRSATRYLERTLARGPDDPYFGPAFRRYTDIALQGGQLSESVARLEGLSLDALPEDAQGELHYLRGRAHYDTGAMEAAEAAFSSISRRSRFYANAQYFRGVIATRDGRYDAAEDRFCSIATTADQDRFTFYVDDRYFRVKDLAWLALGRVAHEGGRSDDAFYYYFQVPNDSERVAEALFEAAYAMYEGEEHDTALDLLDQLEARFPASPFVDEAMLLRGYVHLGRCEFEQAAQLFVRFQARFGPLVARIDAILASATRQRSLYRRLLDAERARSENEAGVESPGEDAGRETRTLQGLLLSLLRVDPTFYELHSRLRTLESEAARAGRLESDLRGLAMRLGSDEAPAAAAARAQFRSEAEALRAQWLAADEILVSHAQQLDGLREAGADQGQLAPLEDELRTFRARVDELGIRLGGALAADAAAENLFGEAQREAEDLRALLRQDARASRRFPRRVQRMRDRLIEAANAAALASLSSLRERLGGALRRSRIGRIDAVMGSKRRIEIQIQSLAAGRFPPELVDPLRIQGLLRDDEEYWPFEGERWADEFRETVLLEGAETSSPESELPDVESESPEADAAASAPASAPEAEGNREVSE